MVDDERITVDLKSHVTLLAPALYKTIHSPPILLEHLPVGHSDYIEREVIVTERKIAA
jgi:hypothetical protein